MALSITTNAFQPGESIPAKYTCDAENLSPELKWNDAPRNTKSFALICDDPDAPSGTFTHWVLYGVASNLSQFPEGLSRDSSAVTQGKNDFGKTGYGGPCPPRGSRHRYYFKLYALDVEIRLASGSSRDALEQAMKGHILAQAEVMGTYQRK